MKKTRRSARPIRCNDTFTLQFLNGNWLEQPLWNSGCRGVRIAHVWCGAREIALRVSRIARAGFCLEMASWYRKGGLRGFWGILGALSDALGGWWLVQMGWMRKLSWVARKARVRLNCARERKSHRERRHVVDVNDLRHCDDDQCAGWVGVTVD